MMLTTFVANYSLIITIAKIRFFLKLVKKYLVCASRIRQKVGGKGVPLAYNYKRIEREEERSGGAEGVLRDECEGVVAEGESHAVGLGVEGKVLVRHESHGVAQV